MLRVLNVAEKPSVAKEISRILSEGSSQQRPGSSRFNWCHSFGYDMGNGRNVQMVVTSVTGHLMESDFAESHRKWNSCDPVQLFFNAPVVKFVPDNKLDIKTNLEIESRRADELLLWLDCDREGENIGFEVIEVCRAANPRLVVRRARFSALIPRDIHHAARNAVQPDQRMSEAVDARSEIDLRLGAAFTRFQTSLLQKAFDLGTVSFGGCQFPTLRFVVEREREVEAFVEEAFWHLQLEHTRLDPASGESSHARFEWSRARLYDRLACLVLYELCLEEPRATVTGVQRKLATRTKPIPLATVELQKEASRKLRLTSDRTMVVAETLYQRGLLSYPRTETDKFKEGTDLQSLIQLQVQHPVWGPFAANLLAGAFGPPRDGGHDDGAHPPIHPTRAAGPGELNAEEARLYEYVARRFLACCSRDATGNQTNVTVDVAGEAFHTSGLAIEARNYLEVFVYEKWESRTVGAYRVGECFDPTSLVMGEGRTAAPTALTEAELITCMDEHGIGTDATIAEHISKIQKREYATKRGGLTFFSTPLGRGLIESYEAIGFDLAKPALRAKMEAAMTQVAAGTLSKRQLVDETLRMMHAIFVRAVRQQSALLASMDRYLGRLTPSTWPCTQRGLSSCGCGGSFALHAKPQGAGSANAQLPQQQQQQRLGLVCSGCRTECCLPTNCVGVSAHTVTCALCNSQAVSLSNANCADSALCPSCFGRGPPAQAQAQAQSQAPPATTPLSCAECVANCPLAGGFSKQPLRPCPKCDAGWLALKRPPSGGWLLGCNAYPVCRFALFLPPVAELRLTGGRCPHCAPAMLELHLRFKRTASLNGPTSATGPLCGCSAEMSELLERAMDDGTGRDMAWLRTGGRTGAQQGAATALVLGYPGAGAGAGAGSRLPLANANALNSLAPAHGQQQMLQLRARAQPDVEDLCLDAEEAQVSSPPLPAPPLWLCS